MVKMPCWSKNPKKMTAESKNRQPVRLIYVQAEIQVYGRTGLPVL
jgi:hypothetical protein